MNMDEKQPWDCDNYKGATRSLRFDPNYMARYCPPGLDWRTFSGVCESEAEAFLEAILVLDRLIEVEKHYKQESRPIKACSDIKIHIYWRHTPIVKKIEGTDDFSWVMRLIIVNSNNYPGLEAFKEGA